MTDYRKIMSLLLNGHSYRDIEAHVRASQKTIAAAKKMLHEQSITPTRLAQLSDAEITALFPDGRARASAEYLAPDYGNVAASMKKNCARQVV